METLCKFNAYCDVLLLDQFFNQYQQNTLCYHISLQKNRPYLQQLFGVGNYLKQHNMSYNIGRLFELVGEFKVAQSFYQRCVQISLTKKLVQKSIVLALLGAPSLSPPLSSFSLRSAQFYFSLSFICAVEPSSSFHLLVRSQACATREKDIA